MLSSVANILSKIELWPSMLHKVYPSETRCLMARTEAYMARSEHLVVDSLAECGT
jgi:hypothetical protein